METVDHRHPSRGAERRRRPVLIGAASFLGIFAVIVVLIVVGGDSTSGSRAGLIGRTAPDVELPALDGTPVRLSQFQGRRVIVNFFNDWCAPCREELPDILSFNAAHADDPDVQWVWIARQYTERGIRQWADANDPPGLVLLDPGGRASDAFRTTGQPETFAIDPAGTVRAFYTGPLDVEGFEQMLGAASGLGGSDGASRSTGGRG